MADTDKAQAYARGLLKAEMAKRDMGFDDLAAALRDREGVEDTPKNLSNKISRGSFTAAFMLQCMRAMGVETLRLD